MPIPDLAGAVEIGVGRFHVCIRKADGTVWCRGTNNKGQAGAPPSEWQPITQVPGLPGPAVEISVEDMRSCARLVDDSVWCWGATVFNDDDDVSIFPPQKLPVPCPESP